MSTPRVGLDEGEAQRSRRKTDSQAACDLQPVLTSEQRTRYARHVLLPEVGEAGQLRVLNARVRVVGSGRAAEEAAIYLAAAGIGQLVIDLPLAARIAAMNPDVHVSHAGDGVVVEVHGDRRADGAQAALNALMNVISENP